MERENEMDFKEEIALGIAKVVNLNAEEIKSYIEIPKEESNGDYAFPCFKLAKRIKTITSKNSS